MTFFIEPNSLAASLGENGERDAALAVGKEL
jgi:hypothetical protein